MARDATLTVTLPKALFDRLEQAAGEAGTTPAYMAQQCIEQHLNIASRHLALIDRLEGVDAALLELANFVGEAVGSTEGFDASKICRYRQDIGKDEAAGA